MRILYTPLTFQLTKVINLFLGKERTKAKLAKFHIFCIKFLSIKKIGKKLIFLIKMIK